MLGRFKMLVLIDLIKICLALILISSNKRCLEIYFSSSGVKILTLCLRWVIWSWRSIILNRPWRWFWSEHSLSLGRWLLKSWCHIISSCSRSIVRWWFENNAFCHTKFINFNIWTLHILVWRISVESWTFVCFLSVRRWISWSWFSHPFHFFYNLYFG